MTEGIIDFYYYVLICHQCEPPLPMPFESAAKRERWAGQHTTGTGHTQWTVIDQPK
jgi:hypothetical protein